MEPKPNPTRIATKWALISTVTSIVITYAIQLFNIDPTSPVKWAGYVPFILFLFLTQKEFRDSLGGYLTFGQGFSAGFRYALFTGLLVAIFTYLYLTVLSPDMLDKSLQAEHDQMVQKGLSEEQINKAVEYGKKLGPPIGAFAIAIGYAVMGAIISLIGAAIFKKEGSPIINNDDYVDPAV